MRAFFALFMFLCVSSAVADEDAWPRTFQLEEYEITAYAPELTSIKGTTVKGRSAFSVTLSDTNMVFGAMSFTATFSPSVSDPAVLELSKFIIHRLRLPDEYEKYSDTTARAFERTFLSWDITTTSQRLHEAVKASGQGAASADIKNEAPNIVVRYSPSMLVSIDGDPKTKAVENTIYEYVVNSVVPIIYDPGMGYYYLPNGKYWYRAQTIKGEWSRASSVPKDIQKLVEVEESVDEDNIPEDLEIVIATKPTELIAFDGEPSWRPVVGTDLLVAKNTESDVFKTVGGNLTYILISGRWFSSKSLKGPWTFVEPNDLPKVFAEITPDSDQGSVLAAVAGTDQAEDAILEAYIPKTATVDRASTTLTVKYDGEPWFEKVSGPPSMEYAVNTTTPVLKISGVYYAVDDGVWFRSSSPSGPWEVSDVRPDEVDKIPSSSPVSNVKYVYVYNSTPTHVYVGYTPGYYGTFVYGPTIVYGTGWYYNPWYGPHFYPRPYTYGFHVHYTPYWGWGFGYSTGWAHVSVRFGPTWYRAPYYRRPPMYRPPAYRPPGYRPPAYRPPPNRIPASRPSAGSPATRPSTRPSTRPATRPSTQPATRPSTNPSTGYRPSVRPNVPSGSVQHPTTRPSTRPGYSPSARPSTRPATRPSGGQMRGRGGRRR